MVKEEEYYRALNLSPDQATPETIKKAYRKLSLKWHPDKNVDNKAEAEEKFKEISLAYQILSDPEKKEVYDRYGKAGLDGNTGGGHGFEGFQHGGFHFSSPEDIFAQFFGTNNIFDLLEEQMFMGHGSRSRSSRMHMHSDPFGDMMGMNITNMFGGPSSISISSGFGGPGSFSSSVSTSTQIINGKRVEKTTRVENGVTTVEIKENGVTTSKTVNGQNQLTNGQNNRQIDDGRSRRRRDGNGRSRHNRHHRDVEVHQAPRHQHIQQSMFFNDSDDDDFQRAVYESTQSARNMGHHFSNQFGNSFFSSGSIFGNNFPF